MKFEILVSFWDVMGMGMMGLVVQKLCRPGVRSSVVLVTFLACFLVYLYY